MSRWLFASISTTTCCALYPIIIIPTSLTFFFTFPGICCCRQFVWASSFILPRLLIWVCYKEPSQTVSPNKREREDGLSIRYFVIILDLGFLNDGKRKTAVQCNVLTTTEALTFPFSGTLISGLTNWLSPSSFMHVPDHPSPSPSSA